MTQLHLALPKDLKKISELARIIWNKHYTPIIGNKQVSYMLNKMYSEESLFEQMHHLSHQFFLIEHAHLTVGFISVSSNNNQDYQLNKFYILNEKANSGIGTDTLNCLYKIINPKSLTLNVNRKNYKSINFYFKNGYKIIDVKDIDIGNGFEMNDFIMLKNISI